MASGELRHPLGGPSAFIIVNTEPPYDDGLQERRRRAGWWELQISETEIAAGAEVPTYATHLPSLEELDGYEFDREPELRGHRLMLHALGVLPFADHIDTIRQSIGV